MGKKYGIWFLKIFFICISLAAGLYLAAVVRQGMNRGFDWDLCREVLNGKTYQETIEFGQQASNAVTDAVEAAARSSQMEMDGEYNPGRIVRVRDYLKSKTLYDHVTETDKMEGLCYRLEDLYQWSLKGATIRGGVLWEDYKPLFYGSIQEYVNACDEAYNTVVNEILRVLEAVKEDRAAYEKSKRIWAADTSNMRYALWEMGSGRICTNADALQRKDLAQSELEEYFRALGSYYLFDSRTPEVAQSNIEGYHFYDIPALLTGRQANIEGEYLFCMGVDTAFSAPDQMAAQKQAYEELKEEILPYMSRLKKAAAVWLITLLPVLIILIDFLWKLSGILLGNLNIVVRIGGYFAAYELVQALIRRFAPDNNMRNACLVTLWIVVLYLLLMEGIQRQKLLDGVRKMASEDGEGQIPSRHMFQNNREMAEAVNALGEGLKSAMQEQMKSERMKADLITNVSHDLKTPLTSVINYVDLMKREKIDNPKAQEYLDVLDQKSQRLKQLTEDLVEASRASSGNLTLDITRIDFKELLVQTSGEFEERFARRTLALVTRYPDAPVWVEADGRRLWRVIENLYRNVEKYAMPHTRVYLDVECYDGMAAMSMKNISEQPLNISAEELTERFTRGDESRSTEGSGLGLAIAKDLTELQGGMFEIYLDGDLFKVTVAFPLAGEVPEKE